MKNTPFQEFEIMQNSVLGAYALWAFVDGFFSVSKDDQEKLTLWHIITVLPLVYHEVSRKAIYKRRPGSGLRSILDRDLEIDIAQNEAIFNLANRLKSLQERTFRSLNCAIAWGFVDIKDGYILPSSKFKLPKKIYDETRHILKSSQKLGFWAGNLSIFEYFTILGVKPQS